MQTQMLVVDNLHESAPVGKPAGATYLKKSDKDVGHDHGEGFFETLREVTTASTPREKVGSNPPDKGPAADAKRGDISVRDADSDQPVAPGKGADMQINNGPGASTDISAISGGAGVQTAAADGKAGGAAPDIDSLDAVIPGDLSTSNGGVPESRELSETVQAGKAGGAGAKNPARWASENAVQKQIADELPPESSEAARTSRQGHQPFQKEPAATSAGLPAKDGQEIPAVSEGKATRNREDLLSGRNSGSVPQSSLKTASLNQAATATGQETAGNAAGGAETVSVAPGSGSETQAMQGFSNEVKGAQAGGQNTGETQGKPGAGETGFLSQIVERAVLSIKRGQSDMKIMLKPEFLGNVRMHISTENQHVTVKIIAETHGVKEVIENNLSQLKADLQHQGLKVDSFDVSTSKDPHREGGNSRHFDFQKKESQADDDHTEEKGENGVKSPARRGDGGGISGVIDFFA